MSPSRISIENASWSEPRNSRVILHPTSFDLMPKRILGIVGPNGAGKSTLLRLLYRYLKPTTGRVMVDDTDIWEIPARVLACKVAAVLQEHRSDFSFTVKEIVALGRIPHRKWFGSANGIRDNEIIAITNPFPDTIGLDMGTLEASVVTISNNREQHNDTDRINGDPSVFNSAGEYEYNGIGVQGVMTTLAENQTFVDRNIAYSILISGIHILHLGDLITPLTPAQIDELLPYNVLQTQ